MGEHRETKYSGMEPEERLKITQDYGKRWRNEHADKLKEYKAKQIGKCELCNSEYKNLSMHKNTKKHKLNELNK